MVSKAVLKQRRKRLLVLADFLENVVKPGLNGRKFNMQIWGKTRKVVKEVQEWYGSRKIHTELPETFGKTAECGFVGCAAGWSYYCPQLVKAGIRQVFRKLGDDEELDPDDAKLAQFFGLAESDSFDYDDKNFDRCFMPARRGSNTGAKGVDLAVKRLREVANEEIK